jgi:hypothetical protein
MGTNFDVESRNYLHNLKINRVLFNSKDEDSQQNDANQSVHESYIFGRQIEILSLSRQIHVLCEKLFLQNVHQ